MEIDWKRFKLLCEGHMLYNGIISWIAHAILAMLIQQEQLCSRKNRDKKWVWNIRRVRKGNYE
ncbi:hypothetical protein BTI77_07465 [Lactobacillus delbrueckii subsp. bulgaricus]|nr:hypothetical protein [Lactobacillus delbrueckii subsp. bulgaricus]